MSLDQNLFTLNLTQNKDNPKVVDLTDPSGVVHYRKERLAGQAYKIEVYDPLSHSVLVTATSPAATSKAKILELHNPSVVVELKSTGTLSFRWSFSWEEHQFEWKREECFMVRKPDPPVLVAITKEPTGRLRTTSVQILDYNLNRFDIDDRKGLEIALLTALLTFQDLNEDYHIPESPSSSTPASNRQSPTRNASATSTDSPPIPPPKPARKTGVERISEIQALRGVYNEITIEDEGHVNDYAEYCSRLLEDDALLFITLKSASGEQVPKVLQVVEQTKRIRHKAGLSGEAELHQYVLYDTAEKGPKRIVLDDDIKSKSKYTPPDNLVVHLSKIDMPELQPKAVKNKSGKSSKEKEFKTDSKPAAPSPTSLHAPSNAQKSSRSSSSNSPVHRRQVQVRPPPPLPSQPNRVTTSTVRGGPHTQLLGFPVPDKPSPNSEGKWNVHSSGPYSPPGGLGGYDKVRPPSAHHSSSGSDSLPVHRPASAVPGFFDSLRRR